MRLGSIIYVVPFFFVVNPALIGHGPWWEVVVTFGTALVGVWLIASAFQGYAAGFGAFPNGPMPALMRVILGAGGLFFAAPGSIGLGLDHVDMAAIGGLLAAPALAYARITNSRTSYRSNDAGAS
jgi:TRAP-type uncharacterized transport system fused permease subunit